MFNPTSIFSNLFKNSSQRELDKIKSTIEKINSLEDQYHSLSKEDFPKKTLEFKSKIEEGKPLDELIPDSFALVREASKRALGERHFDVQLVGGCCGLGPRNVKVGRGVSLRGGGFWGNCPPNTPPTKNKTHPPYTRNTNNNQTR